LLRHATSHTYAQAPHKQGTQRAKTPHSAGKTHHQLLLRLLLRVLLHLALLLRHGRLLLLLARRGRLHADRAWLLACLRLLQAHGRLARPACALLLLLLLLRRQHRGLLLLLLLHQHDLLLLLRRQAA
jgi:hypothetical protein